MNTQMLINVLEDHNFNVALVEGDTELTIACPLCFDERSRLYIEAATGLWKCFRCQEKGHLRRLLIEVCEMTTTEAYPLERAIMGGGRQKPRLLQPQRAAPPPSTVGLPSGFQRDQGDGVAAQYLQSRGLEGYWAREMGMGYCLVGPYHHRVIVPIVTQGAMRTFVARTWLKDERKPVLMPPGSQASRALFGYDKLDEALGLERGYWRHLILVEGVFDALAMWQFGYRETVATLGAHLTDLQRSLVKRLAPRRVVLLRDGDAAGRETIVKESQELAAVMLPVAVAVLPEGLDPGSASSEQIGIALDNSIPIGLECGREATQQVIDNEVRRLRQGAAPTLPPTD